MLVCTGWKAAESGTSKAEYQDPQMEGTEDCVTRESEEFNEECLADLYSKGNVFEEKIRPARLLIPRIPAGGVQEGSEDSIIRAFRKRVEDYGIHETQALREAEGVCENTGREEEEELELVLEKLERGSSIENEHTDRIVRFMVEYRKRLKNMEARLVEMYNGVISDDQEVDMKMHELVKDSIRSLKKVVDKTLWLQRYLSNACYLSSDMLCFLKKACKTLKKEKHSLQAISGHLQ